MVFWSQLLELFEDDIFWDIQEVGQVLFDEYGYCQYEIFVYVCDGLCVWYNLNYWSFGDFFGIGVGVYVKLSVLDGCIVWIWKICLLKDYFNL